jgi:transcriptional regulator with XRE-family HTH domain
MTTGRRRLVDEIPPEQVAVVGANIRTLRLRKGWTQAELGELMGWPTTATVCGAEGHRDGRQRGFTFEEIERLAETFGVPALQLMTRCANCGGHPPTGFACLTCGVGLNMKPVQADRTQLSTEEEHPSSRHVSATR